MRVPIKRTNAIKIGIAIYGMRKTLSVVEDRIFLPYSIELMVNNKLANIRRNPARRPR